MQPDTPTLWDEFWPPRPQHLISAMPLATLFKVGPRAAMLEPVQQLGAFVNAIRELQSVADDETDLAEQSSLRHAAAQAIRRIASLTFDKKNRAAITARAELVAGATPTYALALTMYEGRDAELVVFCGNLKTWYAKTGRGLYSAFVAVPDATLQSATVTFDTKSFLEACQSELDDGALSLGPESTFVVADLVMCAGEANRHPKHFAYFFPEDDWDLRSVTEDRALRTVVFPNVYYHRWLTNSRERLRRFAPDAWSKGVSTESTVRSLLVRWMHGHDLGHAMRHPGTDIQALRVALGERNAMTVEEALADCYGYLLISAPGSHRATGANDDDAMACFIGEMLRYAARGRDVFQDADAALLELAYLHDVGAIVLEGTTLKTDPVRFRRGMCALARTMTPLVLDGRDAELRQMLASYLRADGTGARAISEFTAALFESSDLIPGSATYVFPS